jgi:hypothetical protein
MGLASSSVNMIAPRHVPGDEVASAIGVAPPAPETPNPEP